MEEIGRRLLTSIKEQGKNNTAFILTSEFSFNYII
jgi:hypothetical protein